MRILLCGSGSCGKTTLCRDLVKESHLVSKLPHIKEIARKIIDEQGLVQKQFQIKSIFIKLQEDIVKKQSELESQHEFFISDRSALDPVTYVLQYPQYTIKKLLELMPLLKDCISRYRSSLLILIHPLKNFEDDGVRRLDDYERRVQFTAQYKAVLQELRIPFLEICTHDHKERMNIIKEAIAGRQSLQSYRLDTYNGSGNQSSSRNGKKTSKEDETIPLHNLNFPFYLVNDKKDVIKVPKIQISELSFELSWIESSPEKSNRFLHYKEYDVSDLFMVQFSPRVRSKSVQKLLLNGVCINGDIYNLLGCSSSGLKLRKCYLYRGSKEECGNLINELGDFKSFSSVSKKMARVGLLFSEVFLSRVSVSNIVEVDDIERNGKTFSDGCGGISIALAEQLFSKIKENDKAFKIPEDLPLPSVFQIRLQGYKGVVALNKELQDEALLIRPSMIKFKTDMLPEIGICDFSKPHTFGHLNKQFIALLSGLGISDDVFLNKQSEYFLLIENMLTDPDAAIKILQWHNEFRAVSHITRANQPEDNMNRNILRKKLLTIQSKLVESAERLRLLIVKSRTLFGICDPHGVLDYGQCFLRLTVNGEVQTLSGKIVVGKNPSYLLSDIRVLDAIDEIRVPELSKLNHLHDCVVFPTKGKRPHPDEIAGSDLDGDMYFVSWDPDLIPKSVRPPYDYPSAKSQPEGRIDFASQVKYFSEQNQVPLGHVDRLFWLWADRKGVSSQECERLGQIFSRTVDSAKSGEKITIPNSLKQVLQDSNHSNNASLFVWQKMLPLALEFKECIKGRITINVQNLDGGISYSCISSIIQESISNLSEFQKFDLAWHYFLKKGFPEEFAAFKIIEEFGDSINFSLFTNSEKRVAFDRGVPPNIIHNALNRSKIIPSTLLNRWNMTDPACTWHLLQRSQYENFEWNILLKVLSTHDSTMIILQMPDGVKFIFQFNQRFDIGQSEQAIFPGSVVATLVSEHFDISKRYVLGDSYQMDLTADRLQIYEGKFTNTFIHLKSSAESLDTGDSQYCVSVALNRFDKQIYSKRQHPKVRKVPFEKIEIFVAQKPLFFCIESNDLPEVSVVALEEEVDTDILDIPEMNLKTMEFPAQDCKSHLSTLAKICAHFGCGEALPNEIIESIENSVFQFEAGSVEEIVNLIYYLHRLRFCDLAMQVSDLLKLKAITTRAWLELISMWYIFWFLDDKACESILSIVFPLCKEEEPRAELNYIKHMSWLLVLDFVKELATYKVQLSSKSSENILKNLKVDCHPEEQSENNEKIVAFYSTSLVETLGDFKSGQMVAVFRQKLSSNFQHTICIGEILTIRQSPLSISIKIQDEAIPLYLKYCRESPKNIFFQLSLVGNVITYNRCLEALCLLTDFEKPRTTLLTTLADPLRQSKNSPLYQPGLFKPRDSQLQEFVDNSKTLNESQIRAVRSAVSEDICLIQGPPGTGKTTVASEIIRFAHREKKFNGILVCAQTNLAVDNIARKLLKDDRINILRVGNTESVTSDLFHVTLDGQLKRESQLKTKSSSFTDSLGIAHRNTQLVNRIIKSSDVVLTTSAGSGDPILKGFKFEFVLCDEATQSIEPVLLCALVHGSKNLCLIGDTNQIGPFQREKKALNGGTTDLPGIDLLNKTLFHRLQERCHPVQLLNTQYRMHPAIMKFPSETFYGNALLCGVEESERPLPFHFKWPTRECPIAFIPSEDEAEKRKSKSWKNVDECNKVLSCVKTLLAPEGDLMQADLGVITPYSGQVITIREELAKLYKNIEVKTVDGFQGREKEVILVSLVRSNNRGDLGFVDDANRMNVLLTRAKRGLIIVGNRETLSHCPLWKQWMDVAPIFKLF